MEQRLSLKKMILNKIDQEPRGYATVLAKVSGYGDNPGNLIRILKDEKKEFDKFQGLIDMVIYIWDHDAVQKMVGYSTEVDPNKKTARFLLEYLSTNRQFETFNNLLDRMDDCSNKESKEWAKVYRFMYTYQITNAGDVSRLLQEISLIKTNTPETNTFKKILLNYFYNKKHNYNMTTSLAEELELDLQLIENEYIKEMYSIRLNEVNSYNQLRAFNNPEMARKCAFEILDSNAVISRKAYAEFIIGYSYIFTSHEKAIAHLAQSKLMYSELGRDTEVDDINEKIEFVNVYWNKKSKCECIFKNNYLFSYIRNENNVYNELDKEKENIDEAFYLFLEGLNEKNNKKLLLSVLKYVKKNDAFLANLARIELIKNGYDEEILEEMINLHA